MHAALIATLLLVQQGSHEAAPKSSKPAVTSVPAANAAPAAAKPAVTKPLTIPTPRPRETATPSYRVALRMKNGRRFVGLVSHDRAFQSLVHAGAHHGDAAYKREDRFMLRFVDGLDGDVELSWSQLARLEVREILEPASVRGIEETYAGARAAREAEKEKALQKALDEATAPAADAETSEPKEGDAAARTPEPKQDAAISLLTEFSPEHGWTPERKKQVEWRRTVVGVFPDAAEQRFLDVYDRWLPLYEQQLKEARQRELEKEAAKSGKGEARGSRAKKGDADGERPKESEKPAPREPVKEGSREPEAPPAETPEDGSEKESEEKPESAPATEPAKEPAPTPAEKPADDGKTGGGRS